MDQDDADLRTAGQAFLRECRGRRLHPTTLRLGHLGGSHVPVPEDPVLDPGLRADLVEQVLDGLDAATALGWITRGGALSPGDVDFAWYAAASAAFGRHGTLLRAFYVITPDGWLDLVSDRTGGW